MYGCVKSTIFRFSLCEKGGGFSREFGKTKPIILAIGDDLILHYEGKRSVLPYLPSYYHELKTLAHIPCALCNIEATAQRVEEKKEKLLDAIANVVAENNIHLQAHLGYLRQLESVLKKDESILKHLPHLNESIALLIDEAAKVRIQALHKAVQGIRKGIPDHAWSHLAVLVLSPHMPRELDVAMLYFKEILEVKEEKKGCPLSQKKITTIFTQRLIYGEAVKSEQEALDLLATHVVDEYLGEIILKDPDAMHKDVLGPSAIKYLQSLGLKKM